MNTYPYLAPWLQCLQQLTPPRGLVHIGPGACGSQYPYAAMPSLLVLEADSQHHARLQAQLQNHPNCQVHQAVVAGQSGTADFYTLSQTNESGLCPATALQTLWPNIKTLRAEPSPCSPLKALLPQAPGGPEAYNWVVIDCLPAHHITAGAGDLINHWDVVTLRAFKDSTDADTQGMCLPALRQQLAAFGLEFVGFEEENHPQMVRALFVRNPAQQVGKHKAALAALQAQHSSLVQEQAKTIAASAELTKARDQLGIQKEAECKAKAEALAQRDAEAKARAEALAQRDAEAKAKTEALAQRDAEAKAKLDAIAQRDALAKDKAALSAACDEQAKLAIERQNALAAQQKDASSKLQRLQQLEAENQEHAARQHMLQEELIKAEAQIDLIKDLLLREPGV